MPATGVMPAVLLVLTAGAHAQSPLAHGVELEDVVSTVLAGSPDIEQARLAVESETGALMLAASPFDLEVRAALQRARDSLALASARNGALVTDTVETRTSAVKSFRSGLMVASELSLARVRDGANGFPAVRIDSSVSIRVPLAGGRGGSAEAGAERAARESVVASRLERDHIAARVVRDAVLAYWRYLAMHEQLQAYAESAERARRLVDETEVLIRADERPASDLDLMESNRAQKLTALIVARQTLLDAKYALGVAMGLAAGTIRTLGPPLTGFPETHVDNGTAGGAAAGAAAVRTALAARRDLAALRARRDGTRAAWEGALRDARSRWDIVTRVGYAGVASRAAREAGAALVQGAGGVNGLVQVQYEPVATSSAVRGRVLGRAALHRTTVVAVDDLARRIEANVVVVIEAFENAAQEVLAADDSVRLSERSVLTEQEKFRLGLGTLFDAILAEDALTNARLRLANARLNFAAALVRLRFETGTLLSFAGGTASADANRLTSFVVEEHEP